MIKYGKSSKNTTILYPKKQLTKNIKCHFDPHFSFRLYKLVSDWLEMSPLDSTGRNIQEYFLLDINEMKRNDLWLNVNGNYVLFVGKILLN